MQIIYHGLKLQNSPMAGKAEQSPSVWALSSQNFHQLYYPPQSRQHTGCPWDMEMNPLSCILVTAPAHSFYNNSVSEHGSSFSYSYLIYVTGPNWNRSIIMPDIGGRSQMHTANYSNYCQWKTSSHYRATTWGIVAYLSTGETLRTAWTQSMGDFIKMIVLPFTKQYVVIRIQLKLKKKKNPWHLTVK